MENRVTNFSEAAYAHIKEFLLNSAYYPGQKIPHLELGKRLGISYTPLREAFFRLSAEGLLTHRNQRGFFVPEISLEEAKGLYEARELIEPYMVKKVAKTIADDRLKLLRHTLNDYMRLVHEGYTRQRLLVDKNFHIEIARLADNNKLVQILDQIYDQIIIKRQIEHLSSTRGQIAYKEHVAILKALENRDAKNANRLMRYHLEKASHFVIEDIKRRQKLNLINMPQIIRSR